MIHHVLMPIHPIRDRRMYEHVLASTSQRFSILNDEDNSLEYISIATFPQTVQRFASLFFFHISFCSVDRMGRAVFRQPEKLVSKAYVTGSAINTRDSKAQPMSRELPMFKNRSLLQRTCAS